MEKNIIFKNENELKEFAFIELIFITTPSMFNNDCLTTENSLLFMLENRQCERNTSRKRYKQYNVHKHTARNEEVADRMLRIWIVVCCVCRFECVHLAVFV